MLAASPFAMNADGAGGGGDGNTPAAQNDGKTPETVLFPDENKGGEGEGGEGDNEPAPPAGDGDDKGGAGEWKEYENDPNKSDAENAAAKAEHDKTKPAADDKADKVPEDGKYDLKMPDGVELDAELAAALGPDFKELGLTNKQAQKLVDKYIEVQAGRQERRGEEWAATISKWADDAKADKEIGGDKWDGTVKSAQRAVTSLGTPALREYLNASGGGNHPELIRFMAKVGAMIREDNPAAGGAEGNGKPVDAAHLLFPNDAPKG